MYVRVSFRVLRVLAGIYCFSSIIPCACAIYNHHAIQFTYHTAAITAATTTATTATTATTTTTTTTVSYTHLTLPTNREV